MGRGLSLLDVRVHFEEVRELMKESNDEIEESDATFPGLQSSPLLEKCDLIYHSGLKILICLVCGAVVITDYIIGHKRDQHKIKIRDSDSTDICAFFSIHAMPLFMLHHLYRALLKGSNLRRMVLNMNAAPMFV